MAVRDPQTGRFMASAGGEGRGYDEFDVQNIRVLLDFDDGNTNAQETMEAVHSWEPLGGLARSEIAELVYQRVSVAVYVHNTASTGVGSMFFFGEVSFDSTESTILVGADDLTEQDFLTGIDLRVADVIDIDILDYWFASAAALEKDNTNGTGQSPFTTGYHREIPFRGLYGGGPIVDRHDELFYHAGLQGNDNVDFNSLQYDVAIQQVWDVMERE